MKTKRCIGDFDGEGSRVHTRTRVLLCPPDPEKDDGYVVNLPDPDDSEDFFLNGYWLRPVDDVARLFVGTGEEWLKKRCKVQA